MNRCSPVSTFLVAIAVAFLAGACEAGAPPTAAPDATPQAMGSHNLKAGAYAFDNQPFAGAAGKPFPNIVITVPDGWNSFEGFAVQSHVGTARQMAVSVWKVIDVYANGCHWLGPKIHPGPTVDELATVLATRPLRSATAPAAVSLAGYQGKYLQWSVPVDADFSACDQGTFMSWSADGDRYQQGPGQVDQLWILDVQGHRLVIDATYMPGATEQDRTELAKIVNSIAFKP